MDELDDIFKMYPEMILISKSPMTWKGLLTVTNNYTCCKMKIKVRLIVPSFPSLDDASIQFGHSIAFLFGANFKNQIDSLLKKSETVFLLLQELTATLEKLLGADQEDVTVMTSTKTDYTERLLKELSGILSDYSDIQFSATKDLSAIRLTLDDISMVVQPTVTSAGLNSWKIISSELPDIPNFTINEKKCLSLKDIRNMFQKQVYALEGVWDQLRRIDNYCSVTDPLHPKPYHLYRRIYLSQDVSLLVTLNPLDPTGYPNLKFLGINKVVEEYTNLLQDEDWFEKWDLECSVYENLLTVLNIDDFPKAPEPESTSDYRGGMVSEEECCICFSMDLDDGELPYEICNNLRCRRHFHSTCLRQWLQELANNKIVFNKIFGPCPNCGEEVSTKVSAK
ncbi:hypothetical protein QAD02_023233 [Eretmocerus hayati]|uniref:Uncharacterized protein n=1 Tax=Eretmocerus hayati TaxID=131215 RepID=A0ACC2PXR0_9HYME|nr:hypothetical protein QAD02_023233 [Eretmocerus hayati]